MYFFSRTEFLAARFFDTFFIQCIFYYKLPARTEKYYWKVISSRIPVTRPGFISFYLHAVKQSLNSKQNLRPREILSNDRHNLRGVYWIISCIALVPFCFLCGDTLKWVMRWDSAVDKIVWPQCMTGRWWYPSFEEVKNSEMFWINDKTIIEFGFRMIWRIM